MAGLPRLLGALALLSGAGLSAVALAQEPASLRVRMYTHRGQVRVAYSVVGAFTERFRHRISGGLTSRARLKTVLVDADGVRLGELRRECELRLDVWEDRLYARFTQDGQARLRVFTVVDDALKACGQVDLPIARPGQLRAASGYHVEVSLDLDPVSKELRDRSRRFTSNPSGSGSDSQGLFSAVARLFQSNPEVKGQLFLFRSPALPRPRDRSPG